MLNIYETSAERRSRSASLLGSVAVHVSLILILYQVRTVVPRLTRYAVTQLYLPAAVLPPEKAPELPAPAPRRVITPLVAPHPNAILAKLPPPQPRLDLPAPPELAVTRPASLPVRQPAPSPAPVAPAPPPPVFASALPATVSAPSAAAPRTGSFAAVPATAAPTTAAKLQLPSGAFGAVPATAAPVHAAKLQLPSGAFGAVPADTPRQPSSTTTAGPSGFGSPGVAASNSRGGPSVAASTSFGGVSAAGSAGVPPSPSKPPTKPESTAFGATVAADPAKHAAPPPKTAAEALEILYKPRPVYTEEARRARVEGDVVLEVLFPGAGNLRVLRVVRGLGFGLDQNALDAAAKVRFRPASENGHPVDTVATIRISFQMAY